jgi:hypothetical protein
VAFGQRNVFPVEANNLRMADAGKGADADEDQQFGAGVGQGHLDLGRRVNLNPPGRFFVFANVLDGILVFGHVVPKAGEMEDLANDGAVIVSSALYQTDVFLLTYGNKFKGPFAFAVSA